MVKMEGTKFTNLFPHFDIFQIRPLPGFSAALSQHERVREGVDCDEVFPGIVLGNGATLRKREYLRRIGVTHILNAAEFRGVNLGKDYFDGEFHYMGVRIEDTPQTQICRYVNMREDRNCLTEEHCTNFDNRN